MRIAIVLFIAVMFITVSCKKCETCEQTQTTTVNPNMSGYPRTTTITFEACGDNLRDVDGKTTTATSTSGSVTATVTSTTVCY